MAKARLRREANLSAFAAVIVVFLSLSSCAKSPVSSSTSKTSASQLSCQAARFSGSVAPKSKISGMTYGGSYSDYVPMPAFPWQGAFESKNVTVGSQRTGVGLDATLFYPAGNSLPCSLPGVVIIPGSMIGVQTQVQWVARDLAGHGYVALSIDPMGEGHSPQISLPPCNSTKSTSSGIPDGFGGNNSVSMSGDLINWPTNTSGAVCDSQSTDVSGLNYLDALESGIDWLTSTSDPELNIVNPSKIAVVGHSLGAIVVSFAQSIDKRIKAVVGLDNLSSTVTGDLGSPRCAGNISTGYITPRVPALGEASEYCSSQQSYPASAKETAALRWKSFGIPSMEVVFAGATHFSFAQDSVKNFGGTEVQFQEFSYYIKAFVDLFLKGDVTAAKLLDATTVLGEPLSSILSSRFSSGILLPSFLPVCSDLLTCNTK
ncbi:MAG: hypothetical protein HKL80_03135 [Acidimicrobiales bacterium]|nr:hypothetical protein [Acidimicrobiales bacterium]